MSDAGVSRRTFFDAALRAGIGAALIGRSGVTALAQQLGSSGSLIVHSARPQDLETPIHLLTSWITPNDLFYVRSHFYTPAINEQAWALAVDGDVASPLTLAMNAIRAMPSRTMTVTLECAGNGRGYYDPPVAGVQWRKGAVGTARWTGVPLADVLTRARIRPSAKFLWFDGADVGLGRAPDFIRSLPLEKAISGDTLLAYEMNGEPLPPSHGFPLRVIVPGWEGAYSVKWLNRITASDHDHPGAFVSTSYRVPRMPVAPGATVNPADTEPIRGLAVKSVISSPRADASVARGSAVAVSGFAWGGEHDIERVEVSADNGRTWAAATLGGDRARYTWRKFDYAWTPTQPGAHLLLSRATDASGRTQPMSATWNPGGYLWNGVDRVRVNVAASDDAPRAESVLKSRCTVCHSTDLIDAQRLDAEGWRRELAKMNGWGAQLTPEEQDLLVNHLVQRAK